MMRAAANVVHAHGSVQPAAAVLLWLLATGVPACSAGSRVRPLEPVPLARSVQELAPHGDRDHFVYIVQPADASSGPQGIQVEHVSALDQPGEFEVTLSADGIATGRVHIRDDGQTLWLLSEDDLLRRIRVTYEPPLPYLAQPVVSGERRATATGQVSRLSDGSAVGSMQVTQVVQLSAAPPVHSRLGTYARAVSIHTVRSMHGGDGALELTNTMVLVPGIGEIRSDGSVSGAPPLRRELVCAIIAGRAVGDCHNLNTLLKESNHAGPADLQ